jgi:transcriptional regulator GlxA family with amidase domain
VVDDQHVVKDRNIYTSAGISAGIDLALEVVGHCYGEDIANSTARHMEYYQLGNQRRRDIEFGNASSPSELIRKGRRSLGLEICL